MANNTAHRASTPATVSVPRLDSFPLGSPQQRAAARGLLNHRKAAEEEPVLVIRVGVVGGNGAGETIKLTRADCPGWKPDDDSR